MRAIEGRATGEMPTELSGGAHRLPTVSVVVPVFNGAGSLDALVERLSRVMPTCASGYEVILVDDGSADTSWETICALAAARPAVRGLGLMRNYGQHNALLAGIREARHDVIVTMDDDLQNPPEELPRLLAALAEGADVVYGRPVQRSHGIGRRLSSRITRLVLKEAMGAQGAEMVSPFRAFRREIREGFADAKGPAINIDVLLSWSTTRFRSIPVRHDRREVGRSNYTVRRLVRHALNLLTGFSTQPLRLASMTGFFFTVVGIGILVYVLTRYVQTGGQVHGFAFLASIVCVFAGAQLFTIGIIGEYMARMYHRMMEKPSYFVARATRREAGGAPVAGGTVGVDEIDEAVTDGPPAVTESVPARPFEHR